MTTDRKLLEAIAVLDAVCDARGVICEMTDDVIGTAPTAIVLPTGVRPGTTALRVTFSQRVLYTTGFGRVHGSTKAVRAPYNEHTADWIRALAEQVKKARTWDPSGWATRAAELVAGDRSGGDGWDEGDAAGRLTT